MVLYKVFSTIYGIKIAGETAKTASPAHYSALCKHNVIIEQFFVKLCNAHVLGGYAVFNADGGGGACSLTHGEHGRHHADGCQCSAVKGGGAAGYQQIIHLFRQQDAVGHGVCFALRGGRNIFVMGTRYIVTFKEPRRKH